MASAPQGLSGVEQFARPPPHQIGGLDFDEALGNGELHALIPADGTVEDDALAGIAGDALDEPVSVADALGGDQGALGIQAVEDVLEALSFSADQILRGDLEVLDEELVGILVEHVADRAHLEPVPDRLTQIHDEDRHAFGFLFDVGERRGTGEQDQRDPSAVPGISKPFARSRSIDRRA